MTEFCERICMAHIKNATPRLKEDRKNILHLKEQFDHLQQMRRLNAVALSNAMGEITELKIRLDQAEKMNEKLKQGME